ncbi:MAG: hypothetical protein GYA51_01675 [Candidatus Methanofastidiosa archaeon]|nr:hypothetical protein [Candidatus Methanofastidiosa archaeon]
MKTFQDYVDADMIGWLQNNNLDFKFVNINLDKGSLILFFNDRFCIKIYDRLGHGFGVNINIANKYDESIYENDDFNLSWGYKYFKIEESASFGSRSESQYVRNLQNLIDDIKTIIPRLNQLTSKEWIEMKEWINKESRKQFD